MKPELLKEILERIKNVRIGIIGDFCLDVYWFINKEASEISIETGEPTLPVFDQKYSPGGAGNVANNLAAMETGIIKVFGVKGDDPFGEKMISVLKSTGTDTSCLLTQPTNWATHVYIKPYSGERELSRLDFGNFNALSDETADRLIQSLSEQLPDLDLVIINQQVPSGIHTTYFRNRLRDLIAEWPDKLFITDSRNYSDFFTGTIRKMNDTEAARICNLAEEFDEDNDEQIKAVAQQLFDKFKLPVFVTRGSRGSLVIDEKGISEVPGLMILTQTDTVGAGDSYLAGVAATLAAGYKPELAAEIGAYVAGVTVRKLFQTGTASPSEIFETGKDPDFIYNNSLSDNRRSAVYLEGTNIEIICKPRQIKIRHAIFDNDGTISTLREGWETVMEPVMMESILGSKYLTADKQTVKKITASVRELIDKTTGIQTLRQMKFLADMVRESGYVPEDEILDEHGYKEIYNKRLLEIVRQRESSIRKGSLSIEDFTIKGALTFLHQLYREGVKLYLASGTDVEDVKHEASVLGYDHLFEGRIFGAVGDLNHEAKKIVLDNILESIGDAGPGSIATFGDGPVEIRETRKKGGFTIGLATDELRRFGLNETKRARVIKAGADIVIPDFSEHAALLEFLGF